MSTDLTSNRRVRAAALLGALAGTSLCLAQAAVPGTMPGQRADQPQPGQPSVPKPDFAPPQPNKGTQPAPAETGQAETPQFSIGAIVIRYEFDHPELPAVDDLQKTQVTLGRSIDGFVSPSYGLPTETVALEEIAMRPPSRYSFQAINLMMQAVKDEVNRRGVFGVVVDFSDKEFSRDAETKDLRKPGQTAFTMIVRTFEVKELRTIAFGDRIPYAIRINAPQHARIRANAPIQVYSDDEPTRKDLLRKDLLDNYIFRLNRQPGRRVDVAVSAADSGQPDKVDGLAVDLLVNENRPWFAFFQISNTGTKQTNEWRERFGFVDNQLTGHDDILNIDYITAGFDQSHAFVGSYERPVYSDWLRARIFGNWNKYTAADVGQTDENFSGEGFAIGGELIANVFQHRETFIDLLAGARYQYIRTTNFAGGQTVVGDGDFLLQTFGARLERNTDTSLTNLFVGTEHNFSSFTDTSGNIDPYTGFERFQELGRSQADSDWTTLNWDLSQSLYLDPWFYGDRWKEPDRSKGGHPTLAHELAIAFRGQYAFDKRLIPNFEQVAGGMFTVRGYPESIVAGDSVYVGTIEYRLHVPQAFGYESESGKLFGKPFRWKPQTPYGRADWDLVLKAFLDAGRSVNSARLIDERDHTLVGTGVGAELSIKRNFSLRVDWGVALQKIDNADGTVAVKDGSNRFHILATILY